MIEDQDGSAVVESIFGIFVVLLLALGTIQVALTLYARNVVMAAVHDGARAAIEVGGAHADAALVARRTIEASAGSLLDGLDVSVETTTFRDRYRVDVIATAALDAPGPIPVTIPVTLDASSTRETIDAQGR